MVGRNTSPESLDSFINGMRGSCTFGLMSGIWKRRHGQFLETAATERAGQQAMAEPNSYRARSRLYHPLEWQRGSKLGGHRQIIAAWF
jgi:hypothetical protein